MNNVERAEQLPENKENPGAQPIAQNPNARANENIPEDASHNQDENADIEDEVGTEITDGEDA